MLLLVRLIFSLFFTSSLLFLVSSPTHAAGEFQTDYKVLYTVESSGRTNVTQQITLKNKTANFYADKFELKIGSTKAEDVKASDASGPMETTAKFEDNVTTINVKFNQRVIGLDKTLPWTLTYSSNELATKSGQIWEISIPKVGESADIGEYNATVSIPQAFGPVAFAVPTPLSTSSTRLSQEFTFDKSQLTKSGIAMSFGDKQVFSFDLNYFLENKNLTNQFQEISLPPDNNFQKVVIEKIEPSPEDVTVDADGNFLARYKLSPKEKVDINVTGFVEVFSKPFRNIHPQLSAQERDRYTQPQRYWESDNAWIRDKANELKTPQNIYDFVTNFLTYNQERLEQPKIERKGAIKSSAEPKDSVCMEFTDLFIAIARSAKIPTREVQGFAYTQNERLRPLSLALPEGDILHAWPEYWDDQLGWVQIDPTWGSTSGGLDYFTKLDFNHVTFIQRGISSTSPYPAGSFKRQENIAQKAVFVNFSQDLPQPTSIAELELNLPPKIISGIPARIVGQLKNAGSTSFINTTVDLTTGLKVRRESSSKIAILPPFAKREFEYRVQTKDYFTSSTEPISLTFSDKFITKSVSVIPIYFLLISKNFIVGVILAVVILLLGYYFYERFHVKKIEI